jgi:hypothetical protein
MTETYLSARLGWCNDLSFGLYAGYRPRRETADFTAGYDFGEQQPPLAILGKRRLRESAHAISVCTRFDQWAKRISSLC